MMHALSNVLVGSEAGGGDANLREGAGIGTCVLSVNWVYREVTGVMVSVIVSSSSRSTIELSMAGTDPREPPGGSFNEGTRAVRLTDEGEFEGEFR
jgi:hypothetical protein